MDKASRVILSVLYDGTNSAEVLTMCQNITQYSGNTWSIGGESGLLLLVETNPGGLRADWPILPGQVVVVAPDTGIIARMTPAAYSARYRSIEAIIAGAVTSSVQPLVVAEVAKAMFGGFGVAALPVLLPAATSGPIQVVIQPTQPSAGYVAKAFAISGAAVLTTLSIESIVNTSSSVATVVVKNNGLLSVSGVLLVHLTSPQGQL